MATQAGATRGALPRPCRLTKAKALSLRCSRLVFNLAKSRYRDVPSATSPKLSTFAIKTIVPAVAAETLLLPFWFLPAKMPSTWLPLVEMALTALILPMWFAVSGIGYVNKSRPWLWPFAIVMPLAGVLTSVLIAYLSWALSMGSVSHPDPETVMAVELEAELGCVVSLAPVLVAMALRTLRRTSL